MRWLTGIWVAIALVGAALGATGPSEAALGFLGGLQEREKGVDACLEGSLLSVFCGDAKREVIRQRLESLGDSLWRDEMELEVLEEKVDGDSAGVLVAALGGLNPMDVDVIALGVRKTGDGWRAAPVPGSFENAVDGFDRALANRLEALEDWMGRERVRYLLALEEEGKARLEQRMALAVPEGTLEDGSALEIVEGFLRVCARRDLPAALAYLAHDLEGQRAEKLRNSVSMGLQGLTDNAAWGLLTSPGVAWVLKEAGAEREVLALFYDSTGPGSVRTIKFTVDRVDERWQVMLPAILRDGTVNLRRQHGWTAGAELQREFPVRFEKHWPARRAETLEEAAEMLSEVLQGGRLDDLFRLACRLEGMTEMEKMVLYAEAARLWSRFRDDEEVLKGKLVGTIASDTAGVVVMHRVSARVRAPELAPVLMMRDADGWGLAPGVMGRGDWGRLPKQQGADLEAVLEQFFAKKSDWEEKAADGFLKDFEEVASADALPLTEQEVRHMVLGFREDLREGRMDEVYRRCGLVNRSEGALEALNALRYESRGARGGGDADLLMSTKVEGTWGAASVRLMSGLGHEPDYVLYLVRKTEDGLRVMVDCGLRYVTNAGRRMLNEGVWEHLEAHAEPEDVKLVRKLFAGHNESSEIDFKEWEKNNK